MKFSKTRWIVLVATLGVTCFSTAALRAQPAAKSKTDLGSFVKEIMVLKMEDNQRQLAMWLPFEFFVEATLADSGKKRADVESDLAFLKPYQAVIVQCGTDKTDGTTAYASREEVRSRLVLKLDDGKEILPLEKAPPLVSAAMEAMKKIMNSEGDEGSANMHVFLFPATDADGKAYLDTTKQGKLTLVLKSNWRFKETVIVWHTPFDALTPVAPCRKCHEAVSAKWKYCPWCGEKIENE